MNQPANPNPRYEALSALLDLPGVDFAEEVGVARDRFALRAPEVATALEEFLRAVRLVSANALAELHLRTFDLAPQCVPYLSVHVFGEESFRRSQLMIGLSQAYERIGVDARGELPDHLAVVLRALDQLPRAEVIELWELCLDEALHSMKEALTRTGNPYRFLIQAIREAVVAEDREEARRA